MQQWRGRQGRGGRLPGSGLLNLALNRNLNLNPLAKREIKIKNKIKIMNPPAALQLTLG